MLLPNFEVRILCNTRIRAVKVYHLLKMADIPILFYHFDFLNILKNQKNWLLLEKLSGGLSLCNSFSWSKVCLESFRFIKENYCIFCPILYTFWYDSTKLEPYIFCNIPNGVNRMDTTKINISRCLNQLTYS